MNLIKKNKSLILSLLLCIIATGIIFVVLTGMVAQVPVVVANNNLSVGASITRNDVSVKQISASGVGNSSFASVDQVVGQTVTAGPILAGDIIHAGHVSGSGSLYAALQTYAPKGWVAAEVPQGSALGMKGIKRGDQVDLYGEVPDAAGEGNVVGCIVKNAVVLATPWNTASSETNSSSNNSSKQFIIAVPSQYAPAVAEVVVRGQTVTLTLPERGGK